MIILSGALIVLLQVGTAILSSVFVLAPAVLLLLPVRPELFRAAAGWVAVHWLRFAALLVEVLGGKSNGIYQVRCH